MTLTLQGHEIFVYSIYYSLICLIKTIIRRRFIERTNKNVLITELEPKIPEFSPGFENKYYRFYVHYTKNKFLKIQCTFIEMFESAWKNVCNIAKGKDYHIIFDSYIEQCIKECEKNKKI